MHIDGVRRWIIDMVIDSLELESVRGLGRRGRLSMLSCVTANLGGHFTIFRFPGSRHILLRFPGTREGILVPAFSITPTRRR